MTTRTKKLYQSGLENKKFLKAIKEADNDNKPTMFSSKGEKIIFVSIYYGWLVSEYGINWENKQ